MKLSDILATLHAEADAAALEQMKRNRIEERNHLTSELSRLGISPRTMVVDVVNGEAFALVEGWYLFRAVRAMTGEVVMQVLSDTNEWNDVRRIEDIARVITSRYTPPRYVEQHPLNSPRLL